MAPVLVRPPFHRDGWVYEQKVDGWRMLAYKDGPRVRLISRNAVDHTLRPASPPARSRTSAMTPGPRRRGPGFRREAGEPLPSPRRGGHRHRLQAAGVHGLRRAPGRRVICALVRSRNAGRSSTISSPMSTWCCRAGACRPTARPHGRSSKSAGPRAWWRRTRARRIAPVRRDRG